MGGTTMRGRFGKERNLPGGAFERLGMRRTCVTDPATRIVAHADGIPWAILMTWAAGI